MCFRIVSSIWLKAVVDMPTDSGSARGIMVGECIGCSVARSSGLLMPNLKPQRTNVDRIVGNCVMVEAGWVRVARVDAEVFGFVARRANELLALYVAPGAQGYGVGTALLSDAKSHCPALGLWSYQANLGAARFYQREGFQEIQRTNGQGNEAKLPDIRFEWKREVA